MIYTSYYAQVKNLPSYCKLISISCSAPAIPNLDVLSSLAPDYATMVEPIKAGLITQE